MSDITGDLDAVAKMLVDADIIGVSEVQPPVDAGAVVTRPLLLDLFCGAGGAAMGYHGSWFTLMVAFAVETPSD